MAANTNLRIDDLNFLGIKQNFKAYLSAQDEFRDYNFEGSGLSVILDILSYNTYYNAFYLNMALNESFLSTAQKRSSIVNLAKSLNYTPRSTTSASISGTMTLTVTGSSATITVPKYTEFNATLDGVSYTFLTNEAVVVANNLGVFSSSVSLKEGTFISRRTTVTSDTDQRFLIPNKNVDTST